MKKLSLIILCMCVHLAIDLHAQNKDEVLNTLKETENSKSGNFKDILGSFYQFAFKNLSENENALELNSTLFAIVKNYDNNILTTKSRKDIVFLRNFQINTKLNLDDKYHFNGYSAGFTYAILNKRDKTFINLTGSQLDLHHEEFSKLIEEANKEIVRLHPEINDDDLQEIINSIWEGKATVEKNKELYNQYKSIMDNKVAAENSYFKGVANSNGVTIKKSDDVIVFFKKLRSDHLKSIEKKPLWIISADGTSNTEGKFNRSSLSSVFLVGDSSGELDARIKYTYADTIPNGTPNKALNAKLGYNLKILKDSNNKSLFEIKAYGEYNKIYANTLPNEEDEKILANADFRLRLTEDLWIPFTVKYDTKTSNFLGFLNVTYNFGEY